MTTWSPAEHAGIVAFAEQLEQAMRDVEQWGSVAIDLCGDEDKLRRKFRWYINRHREWMAVYPVVEGGILGGRDGKATSGHDSARYLSLRGDETLPVLDPDDPHQRNTPIVVVAWRLDDEWVVRSPSSIADVLGSFRIEASECNWHFGWPKLNSAGDDTRSLLILASGQYVLALYVCASCRERLDREYRKGLRWLDLDETGQVVIPE